MNSVKFVKESKKDVISRVQVNNLLRCLHEMHKASDFESLTYWYNNADYYRNGLWCYWGAVPNYKCMRYSSHLCIVLSKIYTNEIDNLYKNRIKGAEK